MAEDNGKPYTILQGDCREVLPTLEAGSVDLIATDPPYGAGKGFAGDRNVQEAFALVTGLLPEFVRLLKPGGCLYLCCDYRLYARLELAVREVLDWQDTIIWAYRWTRFNPQTWVRSYQQILFASKGRPAYWGAPRVLSADSTRALWPPDTKLKPTPIRPGSGETVGRRSKDTETAPARNWWDDLPIVDGSFCHRNEPRQHPTQKPEKLMQRIVGASCPPGGLVLDPFLGSGTTLVAALREGRQSVGIELDPGYCEIAEARCRAELANRTERLPLEVTAP